jgi:hypothetical protein
MNALLRGLVALLVPLSGVLSSADAQVGGDRLWNLQSDGSWSAGQLSLGGGGQTLFSVTAGPQADTLLVSTESGSLGWQVGGSAVLGAVRIGSARVADTHISLAEELIPGQYPLCRRVLRAFGSGSGTPLWERDFPFQANLDGELGCGIDDAGVTAAFWTRSSTPGKTWLILVDAATGALRFSGDLPMSGVATSGAIAGDGSALFLVMSPWIVEVDPSSGVARTVGYTYNPDHQGIRVSQDGSRLLIGESHAVRVLERQPGGTFSAASYGSIPWNEAPDSLAMSASGRFAALATSSGLGGQHVTVRCVDLETGLETARDTLWTAGTVPNHVTDLSLSEQGERLAVALSGDQHLSSPQLLVYTCWQDEPIWTASLPGSAVGVELTPDGRRVAVASLNGNPYAGGASDGRYSMYRVDPTPLVLEGIPRSGNTVRLIQRLEGSTQGCLLVAPQLANTPTPFGPLGTLRLDRQQTTVIHGGTLTPEGSLSTPVHLGSVQAGLTLHFQGLQLAPRRLTANRVSVTVMP